MHPVHRLPHGCCYVARCPVRYHGVPSSLELRVDFDFFQVLTGPVLPSATSLYVSVARRPFVVLPVVPVACTWLHFSSALPSEPFAF